MATYGQLISFGPRFSGGRLCTLKVYHYITGTTTLLNVYTDREKTTTEAQPAVSDSDGMVHFYADGLYKFRIDGSTDGVTYTTLDTIDKWAVVDQSTTLSGEGAAISSASTLTLGADGSIFHVTGSTGPIGSISGSQDTVTLVFDSTPTLTHSGNIILQHAVDYTAIANSTLVFFNEGGGVWREVSRLNGPVVGSLPSTVGGIGTALRVSSTTAQTFGAPLQYIAGLTSGNNAGDATNDIDIAAGEASSTHATYASRVILSIGALVKRLDASWVTGTNQGGLSSSLTIGNNDYYIHLIRVAGVDDVGFDTSATAANLVTDHSATHYRRIGWIKRVGATIVGFKTYETEGGGLELLWDSPTLDINLANTLTTTRRTDAVKVPLNFSTLANINVALADGTNPTAWIYCPDQTDLAPSVTVAPLNSIMSQASAGVYANMRVRTSAAGLIAARAITATVDLYAVSTMGFTWSRR